MAHNTIAVICDCDETLCPDTSDLLVRTLGLDGATFWTECAELVERGWDPPLAYLTRLLRLSATGRIEPITQQKLKEVGKSVQFYPGVPDFMSHLRDSVSESAEYRDATVQLEWYIVSGGIEELLRSTTIAGKATDVFGCSFDFDPDGRATSVKRAITFTEKTKVIYAINKGISGEELRRAPYRVNDAIEPEARRIPVDHMVYIGDGPSDIPCFSMIKSLRGQAIGVISPDDRELRKPYELAQGQRLTVGPYTADFRPDSDLYKMLWRLVKGIADSIVVERQQTLRSAPRH